MDGVVALVFLALVVGGVVLFIRQARFGVFAQRLARIIAEEDGFDRGTLERDAKGKVLPADAAAEFERCQVAVDAAPDDWRAWFRLGVAYGDMRNQAAARSAVRRAVALARAEENGPL